MSMILLLGLSFCTALLSGIIGMGGGMILMGVLTSFFALEIAFFVHGLIQLVANGSRFLMHLRTINWWSFACYFLGAAISFIAMSCVALRLDKPTVLIFLGIIPFLSLLKTYLRFLPSYFTGPGAFFSGLFISTIQLAAGVAGPLLDLFFLKHLKAEKESIIANKAITQSLSHCLKVGFYWNGYKLLSLKLGDPQEVWLWLCLSCSFAVLGSFAGKKVLQKLSQHHFERLYLVAFRSIGLFFLGQGLFLTVFS